MKTELLKIDGMSCQHCVMSIKKELSKLQLIIKDVQIGSAEIEYDDGKVDVMKIKSAIENAGFKLRETILLSQ